MYVPTQSSQKEWLPLGHHTPCPLEVCSITSVVLHIFSFPPLASLVPEAHHKEMIMESDLVNNL